MTTKNNQKAKKQYAVKLWLKWLAQKLAQISKLQSFTDILNLSFEDTEEMKLSRCVNITI